MPRFHAISSMNVSVANLFARKLIPRRLDHRPPKEIEIVERTFSLAAQPLRGLQDEPIGNRPVDFQDRIIHGRICTPKWPCAILLH